MEIAVTVFAGVIVVGVFVAIALLMSRVAEHTRGLESLYHTRAQLVSMAEKSGPNVLRGEVDDLAAALDKLRASNRREFGQLWARIGGPAREAKTFENGEPLSDDDELEAVLALQSAQPVRK